MRTDIVKLFWLAAASAAIPLGIARAETPVAVVEDLTGTPAGVEFMDYVEPGKVIKLGAKDSIVLGYIKSCWRETIKGGTVAVGPEKSEVTGGTVDRVKVACDGGKMELAAAQSKQSAAMVFRGTPSKPASPPKPQFVLYGRSPVIELKGGGTVVIERLDATSEKMEVAIQPEQLIRQEFYDLAKAGKTLAAGGIYRARTGNQQLVFQVDAGAVEGAAPVASRLLRFQPAS